MSFYALIVILATGPFAVGGLSESRCADLAAQARAAFPGAVTYCYRTWP